RRRCRVAVARRAGEAVGFAEHGEASPARGVARILIQIVECLTRGVSDIRRHRAELIELRDRRAPRADADEHGTGKNDNETREHDPAPSSWAGNGRSLAGMRHGLKGWGTAEGRALRQLTR